MTHHGPDSGEATTFPHILYSALLRRGYIRMTFCPGTPKVESRNCLGLDFLRLWTVIASRPDLQLGRGLKQCCSSRRELSNAVSHSPSAHRERVDSRLLVVGSQTASLTPSPSFAHNLGCRCSNGSCEAILDIYISRPFQRYKEHLNARCFDPCNRLLSFWESRRTSSSHFWECEFHTHT